MLGCAFQWGFEGPAFQVVYPSSTIPAYNGRRIEKYDYVPRSYELDKERRKNERELLKAKKLGAEADLKAQRLKLEALELQRLKEGLADKQLQEELLLLLMQEQQIINFLRLMEHQLILLQRDEDALMVILLTNPFI